MIDETTRQVSTFYEDFGWNIQDGSTEDARKFEDLRRCSREYIRKCRLRLLRHIPKSGKNFLDMASGPIQWEVDLEFSRGFSKRYCVDLSEKALKLARNKIGEHGVFLHGNFLEMDFENEFFDCCISLYTIFHIHESKQEEAVRKLLQYVKAGAPVIIIYHNPDKFRLLPTIFWRAVRLLVYPLVLVRRAFRRGVAMPADAGQDGPSLYFFAHPLSWWQRFEDSASVQIYPCRSLGTHALKKYIPDNSVGPWILSLVFWLEDRAPGFFAKWGDTPLIVLRKRPGKPEQRAAGGVSGAASTLSAI